MLSHVRNEFLGCTGAITVQNEQELEGMKQFMGIEGLFTKDGNIARQMHCSKFPSTIYRDDQGMYVDSADAEYLRSMHYNIYDFNKVQDQNSEQLNFFGDETAPGIKQPDESLLNADPKGHEPIEADAKVVKNELSLDEVFKHVEIGTITPAKCDGQLLEFKDLMIEHIKRYENVVVTKENYKELKEEIVSKFTSKANDLSEQRAKFNNEVTQSTKPYSNAFSEIIKAIESVVNPLKVNIKEFEEKEKEKQIEDFYKEFVLPKIIELLQNKSISEEQVNQFEFNNKWLKKTATGNLTKATKEGIEAELTRLSEMYAQKQKDIATIKSTVENFAIAHGVDKEVLKADTYISLYNSGYDMPTVQQRINADLENIKRAVEREKEKARIKAEQRQREAMQAQNVQQVQNTAVEEKAVESISKEEEINELVIHNDNKTRELIGKSNDEKIIVKRMGTTEIRKGEIFTYTYEFSGDYGAIKTFSNFLKILSQISNFKYTGIKHKDEKQNKKG